MNPSARLPDYFGSLFRDSTRAHRFWEKKQQIRINIACRVWTSSATLPCDMIRHVACTGIRTIAPGRHYRPTAVILHFRVLHFNDASASLETNKIVSPPTTDRPARTDVSRNITRRNPPKNSNLSRKEAIFRGLTIPDLLLLRFGRRPPASRIPSDFLMAVFFQGLLLLLEFLSLGAPHRDPIVINVPPILRNDRIARTLFVNTRLVPQ